jgi:hypothetical protein
VLRELQLNYPKSKSKLIFASHQGVLDKAVAVLDGEDNFGEL